MEICPLQTTGKTAEEQRLRESVEAEREAVMDFLHTATDRVRHLL